MPKTQDKALISAETNPLDSTASRNPATKSIFFLIRLLYLFPLLVSKACSHDMPITSFPVCEEIDSNQDDNRDFWFSELKSDELTYLDWTYNPGYLDDLNMSFNEITAEELISCSKDGTETMYEANILYIIRSSVLSDTEEVTMTVRNNNAFFTHEFPLASAVDLSAAVAATFPDDYENPASLFLVFNYELSSGDVFVRLHAAPANCIECYSTILAEINK